MMKVLSKNSGKVFLIVVICGCVSVFYKLELRYELPCIYLNIGDALPAVEDIKYSPKPNSIFFQETSCQGGLTSRQACAVESAARANPEKRIYVLFSAAVSEFTLSSSNLANLKLFRNIRLARVHLDKYAENTPLEKTMRNMHFDKSKWRADYISHVLRSITLYKYGGIHLDTDIIVTKSLASLGSNWVAKEDDIFINSAAIAISTNFIGQKLALLYMNELKKTYKLHLWPHNGPGAIARVLSKLCATYDARNWPSESCEVLPEYDPLITGLPTLVQVGENALVNCTSDYSLPAATIDWFVDSEPQEDPLITSKTHISGPDGDGLQASWRTLHVYRDDYPTHRGYLSLKCQATLATPHRTCGLWL